MNQQVAEKLIQDNFFLPTNSSGFLTSKFRGDEINELFHGKHRLWVEILNKYFEDHVEIKKGQVFGFLVIEPENLKFQHVPPMKNKKGKEGLFIENEKSRQEAF